tara:strand:+ start:176 stop:556 length:381 start_codon:yes stop_codon:yes gene_type:complete
MKKYILLLLFALTSLICLGQDKIVKIPQSELDSFFLAVDTLEQQDSIKTVLIKDLELQISNLTLLNHKNDTLILNKNHEIVLLNEQIKLYHDRLKITDRWYNKRWFGVVVGVVGTSTVVYLAGQLN